MTLIKVIKDGNSGKILLLNKNKPLPITIIKEFSSCLEEILEDNVYQYTLQRGNYTAFILKCLLEKYPDKMRIDNESLEELNYLSSLTSPPMASLDATGNWISIRIPRIPYYERYLVLMQATPRMLNTYSVPVARMYEALRYLRSWKHPFLPPIEIDDKLIALSKHKTIEDGNFNQLINLNVDELISIKKGYQVNLEGFSKKLKINNLLDLLKNKPRAYADRTEIYRLYQAPFGQDCFMYAEVLNVQTHMNKNAKFTLLMDGKEISFIMWGQAWTTKKYQVGDKIVVRGMKIRNNNILPKELIHLQDIDSLPIVPIYKESPSNKITTRILTNAIYEFFDRNEKSISNYAPYMRKKEGLIPINESLKELHLPTSSEKFQECIDSLAFFEFVCVQLMFLDRKKGEEVKKGLSKFYQKGKNYDKALASLPFELTEGQQNAINKIFKKLESVNSEEILLNGDVGSGKTITCQLAALNVVDNGYQVALLGPTEILAQQLYSTFVKLLKNIDDAPVIAYMSGNTKAKEKRQLQAAIKNGDIDIIVGTHSLLSSVEYKNLGLVILDEEQKWGSEQRTVLLDARNDGTAPDILSQSATPIPRTTAQAFYGDKELVLIEGKPKNRKRIETVWYKENPDELLSTPLHPIWQDLVKEIEEGHQAFIVTPMVVENEKISAASVKKTEKLMNTLFGKKINIDVIHGTEMTKDKQNKVMEDFRNKKTDVLIASTVVEVGVDIPNATRIIILSAERFGASSLHQIRGRVGRNGLESKCYLVSNKTTGQTQRRLQALVDYEDGWVIALVDLDTRKEGDIFGVKQSGTGIMQFFNINEYMSIIPEAIEYAKKIYNSKYKEQALLDAKVFLGKVGEENDGSI